MTMLFQYLPYILAAGLAALMLFCFFDGSAARKTSHPQRARAAYPRWDDNAKHRD